jgi:hypothetical protein
MPNQPSYVTGAPNVLLRAEAVLMLAGAVGTYFWLGGNWLLFLCLVLVPDLSMLGYLAGSRVGTAIYNGAHWYGAPLILVAAGSAGYSFLALEIGLIWIAHISFDRMIGAGLKYPMGFRFSHLGIYGTKPEMKSTVPR